MTNNQPVSFLIADFVKIKITNVYIYIDVIDQSVVGLI